MGIDFATQEYKEFEINVKLRQDYNDNHRVKATAELPGKEEDFVVMRYGAYGNATTKEGVRKVFKYETDNRVPRTLFGNTPVEKLEEEHEKAVNLLEDRIDEYWNEKTHDSAIEKYREELDKGDEE